MIYLMLIDSSEDKRKFVLLYEKYRYLMMKIAKDVLRDKYLAEDAVHESFIKVAKNMKKIKDVDAVKTKRYLITITKNTAIDKYRVQDKQMKREVYVDEIEGMSDDIVYNEVDVDNEVLQILTNLPVKYRDVFLLKYSNHMSNSEISNLLGISEGTIRQRIARGKKIVEEELVKLEESDDGKTGSNGPLFI